MDCAEPPMEGLSITELTTTVRTVEVICRAEPLGMGELVRTEPTGKVGMGVVNGRSELTLALGVGILFGCELTGMERINVVVGCAELNIGLEMRIPFTCELTDMEGRGVVVGCTDVNILLKMGIVFARELTGMDGREVVVGCAELNNMLGIWLSTELTNVMVRGVLITDAMFASELVIAVVNMGELLVVGILNEGVDWIVCVVGIVVEIGIKLIKVVWVGDMLGADLISVVGSGVPSNVELIKVVGNKVRFIAGLISLVWMGVLVVVGILLGGDRPYRVDTVVGITMLVDSVNDRVHKDKHIAHNNDIYMLWSKTHTRIPCIILRHWQTCMLRRVNF